MGNSFPKRNEQRHNHNRAADLERGRIDQGLVGNPCQHGCGGGYAGAAGRRVSGGPFPSRLPVPVQLQPSPLAAIKKRDTPLSPLKGTSRSTKPPLSL